MINNYEALDLGRFMKIDRILHTPQEEIDKQVQIVAILADMTEDEVLHLPLADYSSMALQAAFLGDHCEPAEMDGKPIQAGGLLLVPTSDFTKITTAQYVDFQTFVKDFPATLPELLSCFLVPEGKQYNTGYDIAQVQEAVRCITLPQAIGLTAFFFKRFNESIVDSVTSLAQSARKNPRKMKELKKILQQVEMVSRDIGAGLPM